ncbi:unnamed protein product [Polarella glacialis]|uniref:Fucosyltransferase n=1 Tax=Polarella glacialis TaxID=89957 RepID=A0A813EN97_POLGL|nr:unnamed protein product [Polarella glacialis]
MNNSNNNSNNSNNNLAKEALATSFQFGWQLHHWASEDKTEGDCGVWWPQLSGDVLLTMPVAMFLVLFAAELLWHASRDGSSALTRAVGYAAALEVMSQAWNLIHLVCLARGGFPKSFLASCAAVAGLASHALRSALALELMLLQPKRYSSIASSDLPPGKTGAAGGTGISRRFSAVFGVLLVLSLALEPWDLGDLSPPYLERAAVEGSPFNGAAACALLLWLWLSVVHLKNQASLGGKGRSSSALWHLWLCCFATLLGRHILRLICFFVSIHVRTLVGCFIHLAITLVSFISLECLVSADTFLSRARTSFCCLLVLVRLGTTYLGRLLGGLCLGCLAMWTRAVLCAWESAVARRIERQALLIGVVIFASVPLIRDFRDLAADIFIGTGPPKPSEIEVEIKHIEDRQANMEEDLKHANSRIQSLQANMEEDLKHANSRIQSLSDTRPPNQNGGSGFHQFPCDVPWFWKDAGEVDRRTCVGQWCDALRFEHYRVGEAEVPVFVVQHSQSLTHDITVLGVNLDRERASADVKIKRSMEGPQHFSEISGRGESLSTTSFETFVPLPYFSWAKGPPRSAVSYSTVIHGALFLARNCASLNGRESLVKLLMEHIRVDSLSSCLHNADPPKGSSLDNKTAMARHYLFLLAFENENSEDYVTEKVWDALFAGTLPVYFGAPNIDGFVPANSIVNAAHFANWTFLGEHLAMLAINETAYNEYHRWRSEPLPEAVMKKWDFAHVHSNCRTCRWGFARREGLPWDIPTQTFSAKGEPADLGDISPAQGSE